MTPEGESVLVSWYSEHVGEPDRRVDVYLGFGLFFAGVALGLGGLALFLAERGLFAGRIWWIREAAFAAGALGLPGLLLGTVVLLPVDRRALYGSAAGAAVCLGAVGFFLYAYPWEWNVTSGADYSAIGVAVYAVGLVAVVAAAGAALVSYHVERANGPAGVADAGAGGGETGDDGTGEPAVTDEQVRADIDEATAASNVSWGGVRKKETKRLQLNTDGIEELDRKGFDGVEAKRVRGAGIDDSIQGLKAMKGDVDRSDRSEGGVDDQASALKELRDQQRAEELASDDEGVVDRLRGALGLGDSR
ncbi:MAG: hypothetical protein V5A62_10545 [Haloarculaceae archaeon]